MAVYAVLRYNDRIRRVLRSTPIAYYDVLAVYTFIFYVNWRFCAHNTNNRNNETHRVRISILIGCIIYTSAFITRTRVMCRLEPTFYIILLWDVMCAVCVFGGCWSRTRLLVWTLTRRPRKTKTHRYIISDRRVYRHRKNKSLKNSHNTIGRRRIIYFIWRRRRVGNWKKITVVTIKKNIYNNNNNNY